MRFGQDVFKGEIPILAPHLLPDNNASYALNTKLYNGNVQAFKGTLFDYTAQVLSKSIYQYRDTLNYWFEWPGDVDVVESPITDDPNNRVYMSGTPDGLRWTDNALALGAPPYPAADRTLVFSPPLDAPVLTLGTEPLEPDPSTAETRNYVYTWVTDDGWESSPSPLSTTLDTVYDGQTVTVDIVNNPGTLDLNVVYARIYRTTPGGTTQFVAQINVLVTQYIDDVLTEDLGAVLVTTSWAPASNGLIGLTGLDQGAFAAFQNNELWFSEPYIPYAWPIGYRLSTMHDIVAISSSSQNIYIATQGRPYVAFGTNPGEYQLVKIDEDLPCVSKRSMVDAGERSYYASTNGIVLFQGQTAALVSDKIIHPDQWEESFDPSNINAVWFENKMFCFTPGFGFIFDPTAGDIVRLSIIVDDVYNSLEENTLYVLSEGSVLKWDSDENNFMTSTYRGKDFIFSPVSFSAARINADEYQGMDFQIYLDDALKAILPVNDNFPFRLPTERARKYSFSITQANGGEMRGIAIASTMSELANGRV